MAKICTGGGARTLGHSVKSRALFPLSYTSEDCWRIHILLRIYARVEAAGTILWAPAYSGWSVARTTATGQ